MTDRTPIFEYRPPPRRLGSQLEHRLVQLKHLLTIRRYCRSQHLLRSPSDRRFFVFQQQLRMNGIDHCRLNPSRRNFIQQQCNPVNTRKQAVNDRPPDNRRFDIKLTQELLPWFDILVFRQPRNRSQAHRLILVGPCNRREHFRRVRCQRHQVDCLATNGLRSVGVVRIGPRRRKSAVQPFPRFVIQCRSNLIDGFFLTPHFAKKASQPRPAILGVADERCNRLRPLVPIHGRRGQPRQLTNKLFRL